MNVQARSLYASPPAELPSYANLEKPFYHVIDLPNGITAPGKWDLRGRVDDYLGNVDFSGKRVLEIGPASGFLTVEMERRDAEVVALEIPETGNWDFVPFPDDLMTSVREIRSNQMKSIRETFWFTHHAFDLKARVVYADACNLPAELGRFDIALLAAVLLHTINPLQIVEQCAKRASMIVITDLMYPDLEQIGNGIIRLHPTAENRRWDTWWQFSSSFFTQFFGVLGFPNQQVTIHRQRNAIQNADGTFFTVVASR